MFESEPPPQRGFDLENFAGGGRGGWVGVCAVFFALRRGFGRVNPGAQGGWLSFQISIKNSIIVFKNMENVNRPSHPGRRVSCSAVPFFVWVARGGSGRRPPMPPPLCVETCYPRGPSAGTPVRGGGRRATLGTVARGARKCSARACTCSARGGSAQRGCAALHLLLLAYRAWHISASVLGCRFSIRSGRMKMDTFCRPYLSLQVYVGVTFS